MSSAALFSPCPACGELGHGTTPLVPSLDAYHCPDCGHDWREGQR